MEKLVRELAVPGLTTDITFDFELFYQDVKAEIVQVPKGALRRGRDCANGVSLRSRSV